MRQNAGDLFTIYHPGYLSQAMPSFFDAIDIRMADSHKFRRASEQGKECKFRIVAVPGRNQTLFRCAIQLLTAFEVLQRKTSVKGGAHTCSEDV